jgi:DNA-binding SARP family transcriptional activator
MQPRRRARQTSHTHRLLDGSLEPVRIWLLGRFSVRVGTQSLGEGEWRLKKATNLVKLLALSPGHRMHREQLMDMLWPDLDTRAAANNLRQTLHVVRRTLAPEREAAARYLELQGGQVALCPEWHLWVEYAFPGTGGSSAES